MPDLHYSLWLAPLLIALVLWGLALLIHTGRTARKYREQFPETPRERLFWSALGFFVALAVVRTLTLMIHYQVGPFHDIEMHGRHIHHLVWGILLLLLTGYLWVLQTGTGMSGARRWVGAVVSMIFGVGAALTLDEFALWLNLRDVYWEREGRESFEALLLFGAALVVGIVGGRLVHHAKKGVGGRGLGVGVAFVTFVSALPCLKAQDTRSVVAPRFPEACTVLRSNGLSENRPDTARIQSAIDSCSSGKAVVLRGGVFLSGPLRLKSGVTLLVDTGAAIFGSRNARDYDVAPESCGIVGERGRGCKPLITVDHAPGSGIMGDGAIDGRGGSTLLGRDVTWWDLAHQAKVMDLTQAVPRLISVTQSNGFTLYRITLRNSPNFHVGVSQTDGFTAWGVKIKTPKTARNTDGIDPSSSTNVTIAHCEIDTGDDNVAIKTGATGAAAHMTIAHNHFYSGHGMSIGSGTSGGVSDILVSDLTIDGADNGIRIKSDRSRGGVVERVKYENVCMRKVTSPILLTSMYTTFPGDKIPVYRDITLNNVWSETPGYVTYLGVDGAHKIQAKEFNVFVPRVQTVKENADVEALTVTTGGPSSPCEYPSFPDLSGPLSKQQIPPEDPTFYVAASGTGDYWSIQKAIDRAPEGSTISIAPGEYRERLVINKPNIHLRSPYNDPKKTVIVADASAGTAGGTLHSATVEVRGDGFTAENLTFANDFNRTHPQLPQGSQALALMVSADRAAFRNMRFLGNQDTLYAGSKSCSGAEGPCVPARQYFADCYIEGNVDFVFGDGKTVFENCEIHSNRRSGGYITAQSKHYPEEDSGYVFDHCKLTAEPGVEHVWLGRPWRPYATVVFLNTEMDASLEPAGWREWHPGETKSLETVYYAEYGSTGPGARMAERDPHMHKLTAEEAAKFDPKKWLGDWKQ
jgi:polygalacturonase